MSSGGPHRSPDGDWDEFARTWGRVLVGVAVGVVGTLLVLKWSDRNDDLGDATRNLKHTAEAKGREFKDSFR